MQTLEGEVNMRLNGLRFTLIAVLFISLLCPLPHSVSAQSDIPPLIDREIIFGDPEIAGAQISPDGRFISFRKPFNGVMNIWMKRTEEPFDAARPMTSDTTRPIMGYFWSQDSKYILYVQDKGGDENYHIYAVDPESLPEPETAVPPARNLTPIDNVRAYIYSVPESTPNRIIIGLNDRNPQLHDVYALDLTTGERELLFKNEENVAGWMADYDGNIRLAIRQTQDGGTEILRVEGEQLISVYSVNNEETAYPTVFHRDNKRVYFVTNKGDRDLTQLVLFDPATGQKELLETDPEGRVDFGGSIFSRKTRELLATYYVGDRLRVYPKDEKFAAEYRKLTDALPAGDIYFGSSTLDETLQLVSVTSDVDPGATYLYNRETGEVSFLYRPRPKLPTQSLSPMQAIRYTARDGREIPAYLTIPKGMQPRNLPVVVFPHGGPWARDNWGYDSYAQFLSNRGYAVFQPNFRGSTGYGKDFLNSGNKEWGTGAMQHDITDGVRYLIDQGIADPERVAIFGGSYGGYATLAGLAFTPGLYAGGISFVGPSNIITLLNSIPPYWAPLKKLFAVRVGDLEDPEDVGRMESQSPLFSAHHITAPLLVVQGANDPRVKKAESDQIVVALRDLGREVEYIVAPDEGHGFAGRENRIALTVAIEKFFADHLGGRYQMDVPEDIAKKLSDITVDITTVELPKPIGMTEGTDNIQLPKVSGNRIKEQDLHYKMSIQMAGQELEIQSTRSIKRTDLNGRKTLKIVDSSTSPMGEAADTVFIDADTFYPIHRSTTQGMAKIKIDYTPEQIKGDINVGPQHMPIDVKLASPVFGDGAALDMVLLGLPLSVGYETYLRSFNVNLQKSRTMKLTVTGTEGVEVAGDTIDAFKVEVVPIDDESGKKTAWISTGQSRELLRSVDQLSSAMGGGIITTEMVDSE